MSEFSTKKGSRDQFCFYLWHRGQKWTLKGSFRENDRLAKGFGDKHTKFNEKIRQVEGNMSQHS